MDNHHTLEHFMIKIKHHVPHDNYLNGLMVILKMLPLVILTHDWNIQFTKCFSYYLSLVTLSSFFNSNNDKNASYVAIAVIIIISLVLFALMYILYREMKAFDKLSHKQYFKNVCVIMYFFNFFLVQYIFMLIANNSVCSAIYDSNKTYKYIKEYKDDCRTIGNIVIIIVQIPFFIYLIVVSFVFLLIISEPFSNTKNVIVTQLGRVNIDLIFYPIMQAIVSFEYVFPFNTMIVIKIIFRSMYMLYYLRVLFQVPKMFFSSPGFRTLINFIYTMCFVSSLIEFFFLFDWKNDLTYLERNTSVMIFKITMETMVSFIITKSIEIYEKKHVIDIFKGKITEDLPYELLCKVFYILNNLEVVIGDDLLYQLIEEFFEEFNEHKEKSKCLKVIGLKCYCLKYKGEHFLTQSDEFLSIVKKLRGNSFHSINKILKSTFPIMYRYIEYFLLYNISKHKGNKNHAKFLLSLVLFYIIFDKNYNKSLFYLSEFMNTKFYKNSKICRFQSRLIKLQLLKDYKYHLIIEPEHHNLIHSKPTILNENSFSEMYKRYNLLMTTIKIENSISNALSKYYDILVYFNDNDCSVEQMTKILKKFEISLHQANKALTHLCKEQKMKNYHLCSKLTLFYNYYYNSDTPEKLTSCYQNIFSLNCKADNYSTLLIGTHNNKNSWKFSIEHMSDELCAKLSYKMKDFKEKEISEIFPESLKKCYEYLILKKIKMGNVQILLKEVVIVDKDKYAHLYDIIGVVIFTGESSQIFFKLYSHNFEQSSIKTTFSSVSSRAKRRQSMLRRKAAKNSKKQVIQNECFVFVNKNGKVITISREFEKFFCIPLNVIKKYKINIFRDMLKIENTVGRTVIKKSLFQIYENIADLNFELMQNNSSEDFSMTYKKIKQLQSKIVTKGNNINVVCQLEKKELYKNEKEIKTFYYVSFNIEIDNTSTTFHGLLGKDIKDIHAPLISKKTTKTFSKNKKFEMNTNINEIYSKLNQIQILSLKYLTSNFKLKANEIFNISKNQEQEFNKLSVLEEKEISTPITSTSMSLPSNTTAGLNTNSNVLSSLSNGGLNSFLRFNNNNFYQPLKKESINHNLSKRIIIQLTIWLVFSVVFIIFQSILMIIDRNIDEKVITLNQMLTNSLFLRNIVYSIISSMTRIQYIVNGLESGETLDNNFNNTIAYHKKKLNERVEDFLNFYKQYEEIEIKLYEYNKKHILDLKEEQYPYVSIKGKNFTSMYNLRDILSKMHTRTNYLLEHPFNPFLFNVSYDTIEGRELLESESIFVLVFENYFGYLKYAWDEMDYLLLDAMEKDTNEVVILIYVINLSNGFLLFIIFIMQSFIYQNINNQIFARYFINYNYIAFFGNLLITKTNHIKEFIENSDITNFNAFQNKKISLVSSHDDTKTYKDNCNRINNKMQIMIKPFKINDSTYFLTETNNRDSVLSFFDVEDNRIPYQLKIIRDETKNSNHYIEKTVSKGTWNFPILKITNEENKKKSTTFLKHVSNEDINLNLTQPLGGVVHMNTKTKKSLQRPKFFLCDILAFTIISICIIIFCLVDALIISKCMKEKVDFCRVNSVLLTLPTNTQEILLIYAITLLKNKQMILDYKSHGYLATFPKFQNCNVNNTHDILEESILYHFEINSFISEKVSQLSKRFFHMNDYLTTINDENACENFIKYYYANKDEIVFDAFNTINSKLYTVEYLIDECNAVGNGVNLKGTKTAFDSLINTVMNYYNDFRQDEVKDSDTMLRRAHDQIFNAFQVEIDVVLDKTIFNYYIAICKDYNKHKKYISNIMTIVFICILFFIILVDVFYLWRFTIPFIEKNSVINEVEPCIYNTIIF